MLRSDLIRRLNDIVPLYLAEDWDNVGLLLGQSDGEVSDVLLTIDSTPDVVAEAIELGVQFIIAYHPIIFHPLKSLTDSGFKGRMFIDLLRAQISVYSPHTALDAVEGGVTDWLCDGLEPSGQSGKAGDRRAINPFASLPPTQQCKLVTFVPSGDLDRIRNALATSGAGIIGLYEQCSFAAPGTGTFRGLAGSDPAIGKPEELEHVREHRLEMVLSRSSVPLAVETLQRFHPYEEAPIDVYALRPLPQRNQGSGRKIMLDRKVPFGEVLNRFRRHLGGEHVQYRDVTGGKPVRNIAVIPGAGASLLPAAVEQGCELFVTGEMKHHEMLTATLEGCSVILGGHTNTERGYLPLYAEKIAACCPQVNVHVSKADRTALTTA